MANNTYKQHLENLLKQDARFVDDEGELMGNKVKSFTDDLDEKLIELLLQDERSRTQFFIKIKEVYVFKASEFKFFLEQNKIDNSFTNYTNQIGLSIGGKFLKDNTDVVLDFPYKDCILEGGQSTEEGLDTYFEYDEEVSKTDEKKGYQPQQYNEKQTKRKEIFFNTIVAKDEIDRLLEPKAFTNITKYDANGESKPKSFTRDAAINKKRGLPADTITDNLIIKGNNLLALHSLKEEFKGKVKLIYIDPPYNTEKDDFKYNDSFMHSTWLTFMLNRLEVAKQLLKEDGVIWISIDNKEQAYLKVLCDRVFNRKNFIGEIIWQTATDNNPSQIITEHEYILCFAKNKEVQPKWRAKSINAEKIQKKYEELKIKNDNPSEIQKLLRKWIKKNEKDLEKVTHYDNVDYKGVFHDADIANTKFGGYAYDVIHPNGKVCKIPEKGYRYPKETLESMVENDDIMFGEDETTLIKPKKRVEFVKDSLRSIIYEDGRASTKELEKLFYKGFFNNPKSVSVLKRLFGFSSKNGDIILDFFAGSGTSAQAVYESNVQDDGERQFILCEQMDYIDTKTVERVRKTIGNNNFTYLELAKNNQNAKDQILACKDYKELMKLFNDLYSNYFLHYNLKIKEFQEVVAKEEKFIALPLEKQKEIFCKMLDNNQLYVNVSEMEDSKHNISPEDIALTKDFYQIKE